MYSIFCKNRDFILFFSLKTLFFNETFADLKKKLYLCTAFEKNNAQMAESVDALVSNTSGFTSIPVRPRVWVQNKRLSIELSIT